MKYVEQIKSVVLLFLVLLSMTLTFVIWNYKPDYKSIEESPVEQVAVGEKKQMSDVLKPYRLLFRQEDQFKGTVSNVAIKDLYTQLARWDAQRITLINNNLTDDKLNEMFRLNDRMTLFFSDVVPLQSFTNVLSFSEKDVPDTSFNRLIIDWSNLSSQNQLQLLFVNTHERTLYRSYVPLVNEGRFRSIVSDSFNYSDYVEVERTNLQSLYVIEDAMESVKYTYSIKEISTDLFKTALFTVPNIVKRTGIDAQSEKYEDATSRMTVDTLSRTLNYVYPAAESLSTIPASSLLLDSFDFLNDHGGITADYRFSSMNPARHVTEYQLYLHGFPVQSSLASTRIITTWGEDRIFRYRRPYFNLDIAMDTTTTELSSGVEIIEYIKRSKDVSFEEVDEIVMGYYIKPNQDPRLYKLEPSWFVITDNVWTRVTQEQERAGGVEYGLE